MTYPERNIGGPGGPAGKFEAMMNHAFGESGGALVEAKQRGYKGPMGEQAFGWRQKGMGQEVGMKTYSASGQETSGQNGGQNEMLFYAMRLPESITQGKRMRLAVFTTDHYRDVKVIKARESSSSNPHVSKNENLAYNIDFDALFRPQDDPDSPPAVLPATIMDPHEGTIRTFQSNINQWPIEVASEVYIRSDLLIEEAVKHEEELKQQREQGATQEPSVGELPHNGDTVDLAVFDSLADLDDSPGFDVDVEAMYGFKHRDLGKLDTELDLEFFAGEMDKRFPGPMGDEIEEMDKQGGAIRIISALQADDNPYRVMTAAIRLNDAENGDPRHALLFTKVDLDDPGNLEKSFDVRVVRPKRAAPDADGRARVEAENAWLDYQVMLNPSDQHSPRPYETEQWHTTPTESPLQSFDSNIANLPFVIDTQTAQTPAQVKRDILNRVEMQRMLRGFTSGDIWGEFGQPGGQT